LTPPQLAQVVLLNSYIKELVFQVVLQVLIKWTLAIAKLAHPPVMNVQDQQLFVQVVNLQILFFIRISVIHLVRVAHLSHQEIVMLVQVLVQLVQELQQHVQVVLE